MYDFKQGSISLDHSKWRLCNGSKVSMDKKFVGSILWLPESSSNKEYHGVIDEIFENHFCFYAIAPGVPYGLYCMIRNTFNRASHDLFIVLSLHLTNSFIY